MKKQPIQFQVVVVADESTVEEEDRTGPAVWWLIILTELRPITHTVAASKVNTTIKINSAVCVTRCFIRCVFLMTFEPRRATVTRHLAGWPPPPLPPPPWLAGAPRKETQRRNFGKTTTSKFMLVFLPPACRQRGSKFCRNVSPEFPR